MYNAKKYKSSVSRGKEAEEKFKKIAYSKNYTVIKASYEQDTKEHWDYELRKGTIVLKIDVKAMKTVNGEITDKYIYVELKNTGGGIGWLYAHDGYVAFELKDDKFVIVSLQDLRRKVESLITDKTVKSTVSNKKLYTIYTRDGWDNNKDQIALIKKEDILSLPHKIWSIQND